MMRAFRHLNCKPFFSGPVCLECLTDVKYTKVTNGSSCERLISKEECEDAARQLGLSDTKASVENTAGWPPSCYFHSGHSLYFNQNSYATSECNSNSRVCICKKSSGETLIKKYIFSISKGKVAQLRFEALQDKRSLPCEQ